MNNTPNVELDRDKLILHDPEGKGTIRIVVEPSAMFLSVVADMLKRYYDAGLRQGEVRKPVHFYDPHHSTPNDIVLILPEEGL